MRRGGLASLHGLARVVLLSMTFAAVGCGDLPAIRAGVCGNSVLEHGETCDGFAQGEASCRPPGTIGACQLDCTLRSDGSRPACPSGWGCDSGDICRKATGQYVALGEPIIGNAFTLRAGDFDGDGRSELLSTEAPGHFGATKFRVHFFDRDGVLTDTFASPRTLSGLDVAQISDDKRSDVMFADGRLGVLLGQTKHSLISETYPSYFLANTELRIGGILAAELIKNGSALVMLAEREGGVVLLYPDGETAKLITVATLPNAHIADLAGDPANGDIFALDASDPCLDVALAMRGAHEVSVYSVCQRDKAGHTAWRKQAGLTTLSLGADQSVASGPLIADVNGDGHLDVLVGTSDATYVAYGDGKKLAKPLPLTAAVDGQAHTSVPMPIAVGDFSGDGADDFVYATGFMFSRRSGASVGYASQLNQFGAAWTEASVVDLNHDGLLDVVAASDQKLDIQFFNGTGSELLNPFVIPTTRPVTRLSHGDFDGDLISDLAFVEASALHDVGVDDDEDREVKVAFGNRSGPPSDGVTAAKAPGVAQVGGLQSPGSLSLSDLFVTFEQHDAQGSPSSSFAWLTGYDRSLVCLVELTTFDENGSVDNAQALALTTGRFRAEHGPEALVLSSKLTSADSALWLMPDLRSRTGRPQKLGFGFDTRLVPVHTASNGDISEADILLLMAAGDLDNDGLDELVIAGPDQDGQHCYVETATLTDADVPSLQWHPAIALEQACSRAGQLAAQDLDGDGAAELVLLTGKPGEPRSLLVLWNDGNGGFASQPAASLAQLDETPQAFALYRATPDSRVTLAYVTDTRVRLLDAPGPDAGHEFPKARELAPTLRHGTGIVATDIDGDSIADLAIADSGDILLLQGEVER